MFWVCSQREHLPRDHRSIDALPELLKVWRGAASARKMNFANGKKVSQIDISIVSICKISKKTKLLYIDKKYQDANAKYANILTNKYIS